MSDLGGHICGKMGDFGTEHGEICVAAEDERASGWIVRIFSFDSPGETVLGSYKNRKKEVIFVQNSSTFLGRFYDHFFLKTGQKVVI